jgi:hypothetical protein
MTESHNAYQEFVGDLVSLDEAQRQREGEASSFASLVDRLAGSGGDWHISSFAGAGLLAGAAVVAAALPSPSIADDSFWRVGPRAVVDVLTVGNVLAVPLALAALVLLALCIGALLHRGDAANRYLAVQPFVGGAGLLGVLLAWAAFLALVIANLVVLVLIIIAYVVATIFITALVIGFFIGLVSQ